MSPLGTPILPMPAAMVACGETGPETEAAAGEDSPGVRGNGMARAGLPDQAARDALLAPLRRTTGSKAAAEGA